MILISVALRHNYKLVKCYVMFGLITGYARNVATFNSHQSAYISCNLLVCYVIYCLGPKTPNHSWWGGGGGEIHDLWTHKFTWVCCPVFSKLLTSYNQSSPLYPPLL